LLIDVKIAAGGENFATSGGIASDFVESEPVCRLLAPADSRQPHFFPQCAKVFYT
jgi:hypothetical protein